MRAQVAAIFTSTLTFVGLGFGPSVVGFLTDRVFASDAAVRYSLLAVTTVGLASAAAFLTAGLTPYRRSVEYRASWSGAVSASGTR